MSLGKIIASDSVADEETGQVFTTNSQGLLIDANDLYGKWNHKIENLMFIVCTNTRIVNIVIVNFWKIEM